MKMEWIHDRNVSRTMGEWKASDVFFNDTRSRPTVSSGTDSVGAFSTTVKTTRPFVHVAPLLVGVLSTGC